MSGRFAGVRVLELAGIEPGPLCDAAGRPRRRGHEDRSPRGHDINFLAVSGVLHGIGRRGKGRSRRSTCWATSAAADSFSPKGPGAIPGARICSTGGAILRHLRLRWRSLRRGRGSGAALLPRAPGWPPTPRGSRHASGPSRSSESGGDPDPPDRGLRRPHSRRMDGDLRRYRLLRLARTVDGGGRADPHSRARAIFSDREGVWRPSPAPPFTTRSR
jgi:hypothetical protein